MLKIAYHNAYIHPLPENHRFPMLKYELIAEQLLYEGIVELENFFQPQIAPLEYLYLAHDRTYVDNFIAQRLDAKMIRRIGFPMTDSLVERERYIIDGTIKSAQFALKYGISFNIAGGTHHAGYDYGEGFCMLNDQAVAASYLLHHKMVSKILIVDLDVHQGNGTAHIFKNRNDVFTFSMHGEKNFPFVKEISSKDIGLPDGISGDNYLEILNESLRELFEFVNPDFVFYQAGVDVLDTDKLGKLKLAKEECKQRDISVLNMCVRNNVPVQISMGGGYSPNISDVVNAHLETFKAAKFIFDL